MHVSVHGGQQFTEIAISEIQWFHDQENIRDGEIILLKLQSAAPDAITPVSLPECNDGGQPTVAPTSIQLAGHILSTKGFLGLQSKNIYYSDSGRSYVTLTSVLSPWRYVTLNSVLSLSLQKTLSLSTCSVST